LSSSWTEACVNEGCRCRGEGGCARIFSAKLERWLRLPLTAAAMLRPGLRDERSWGSGEDEDVRGRCGGLCGAGSTIFSVWGAEEARDIEFLRRNTRVSRVWLSRLEMMISPIGVDKDKVYEVGGAVSCRCAIQSSAGCM
jgi:hypothetical protein